MSDEPWNCLNNNRCKHLRSKEMFYETGVPVDQRAGSGIFWCGHTLKCLGPDGDPVSREECSPERRCFEQ